MAGLSYEARVAFGTIVEYFEDGVFSEKTWVELVKDPASPRKYQPEWRGFQYRNLPKGKRSPLRFMSTKSYEELKRTGLFIEFGHRARVNVYRMDVLLRELE